MHNDKINTSNGEKTQCQPRLKIAIDAHLKSYVIATQIDGACPKPPQRFTPVDFLGWVEKKISEGFQIITCYEEGPFGYVLHRQLENWA